MKLKHHFILCLFLLTVQLGIGQIDNNNIDELIRQRIESAELTQGLLVDGEVLKTTSGLSSFYSQNKYSLAWGNTSAVTEFLEVLESSTGDGLNPEDYHYSEVRDFFISYSRNNSKMLVDYDILLTDAFLLYVSHMLHGKVNPESIHAEWNMTKKEDNPIVILESFLQNPDRDMLMEMLIPTHEGYKKLRKELWKYESIRELGGWPVISIESTLKKGSSGKPIETVKKRLQHTGDFPNKLKIDTVFNDDLEQAIIAFQKRHGIEPDGMIGKETVKQLNVGVEDRINTIKLNLERYRWAPVEFGSKYLLVNIANFELDYIVDNQEVFTSRVIVGRPYRKTPVFSSKMTYLVLNPTWTIPPTILKNDILPEVKKNTEYLKTKRIRLIDQNNNEINPGDINWSSINSNSFPYILRQDPGPNNALGEVKFMFPNKYHVYIHDTPNKDLFSKTERNFSSGCIRVADPFRLAYLLIDNEEKWSQNSILEVVNSRITTTVFLPEAINVYLLYWTSWVDQSGKLNFRNDIYERDVLLLQGLNEHINK